jgi:hypothetical protein
MICLGRGMIKERKCPLRGRDPTHTHREKPDTVKEKAESKETWMELGSSNLRNTEGKSACAKGPSGRCKTKFNHAQEF